VISSRYERDAKKLEKSAAEIATHISSLIFALAVRARMGLSREQLSGFAKDLAALIH
jgi:hypothetical protein